MWRAVFSAGGVRVHARTSSPVGQPSPAATTDRSIVGSAKRPYSAEIKRLLAATGSSLLQRLTVRERPGKHCFRFWQEGPGYDRNIASVKALEGSIDYIHMNPVRRGLCDRPTDWPWSSARYYLTRTAQTAVRRIAVHPRPTIRRVPRTARSRALAPLAAELFGDRKAHSARSASGTLGRWSRAWRRPAAE